MRDGFSGGAMTDLRVGLIGAGMVSQYHLAGWAECPGAQVVAIADPARAHADARAAPLGLPAFASLAEMRAAMALDAVDIVAPVGAHGALIAEAVAVGLPVMCQKPLMPDAESARRLLVELPPDARVMVHENWRWRRPYRQLKAALDEGRVAHRDRFEMRVESAGLLLDADGTYPALMRQPFFADMDRLIVFELLIHHLDTLEFLFGPVEIVSAMLDRRCPAVRGEDRAEITLRAGGISGRLIGDFCVSGRPPTPEDRLWLDGSAAPFVEGWILDLPGGGAQAFDPRTGYQQSYSDTIRHFTDALRDGSPFETPATDGARLLDIVETIYASAR